MKLIACIHVMNSYARKYSLCGFRKNQYKSTVQSQICKKKKKKKKKKIIINIASIFITLTEINNETHFAKKKKAKKKPKTKTKTKKNKTKMLR